MAGFHTNDYVRGIPGWHIENVYASTVFLSISLGSCINEGCEPNEDIDSSKHQCIQLYYETQQLLS